MENLNVLVKKVYISVKKLYICIMQSKIEPRFLSSAKNGKYHVWTDQGEERSFSGGSVAEGGRESTLQTKRSRECENMFQ